MKLTKQAILEMAANGHRLKTLDISDRFSVSRQYANKLVSELVVQGKLMKVGSTRSAFYILSEYASKHIEVFPTRIVKVLKNSALEEHRVLADIERQFPFLLKLKENVRDIFTYAFSEMLNNAIEHSESDKIEVAIEASAKILSFSVNDFGVGVFKNIMQKRHLRSELEAIQDLLKGKTTTMPKTHSGEGIFFTSKAGNEFILESFGQELIVNNRIGDVFLRQPKKMKKGTKVLFKISTDSDIHLSDVFKKFTLMNADDYQGFDKTEIKIRLYTMTGVHISRSQARRVLANLNSFKSIIFDFDKVPMIGQAFADEIFRVFHNKYPNIKLNAINTNEAVKFMVDRVEGHNEQAIKLFNN